MTFSSRRSKEIRERSGYFCQICGNWYPPNGGETGLDAHSMDRSHQDDGLSVCRARVAGNCHIKLHRITNDPVELTRVSRIAAELNSLSLANNLLASGVPEKRVRRIITRLENF